MLITGVLMATSIIVSIYYNDAGLFALSTISIVTIVIGLIMKLATNKSGNAEIKKRDGYLIVAFGWIFMTSFGALPYLIGGSIPSYTDCFFESMSGFTTTGASILNNIEELPQSILFWRSMTQWIGGMGIIVLTIAILPLLGVGGMELFASEAPGPTKDKIHPRIKETAKRLWIIYVSLTFLETILLMYPGGMTFFDAINHSLTTLPTGGFSTKQDSIAYFNSPTIEYIIIFFMILAGVNFTLIYLGFKFQFKKIFKNEEFWWYLTWIVLLTVVITPIVYIFKGNSSWENAFRSALFQISSIVSSTGYATTDYTYWGSFATFIFFLMLFSGASAGSTSGGMKIVRIVLLIKNGLLEFKRRIHPNAIVPVHLNGDAVSSKIIYNLMAFVFLYIFIFTFGSLAMTLTGVDFLTSISAVATSMANIGPGVENVSPSHNFSEIPTAGKWILSFLMLVGRLELFTITILFTPYFWRLK